MGLFDGTPLERPVLCDRCGYKLNGCDCASLPPADVDPKEQHLRIQIEKRKRGKVVTLVAGFAGPAEQIKRTLKSLKDFCGAGGTVEDSTIEIQGDHRLRAAQYLSELGYKVARN